jgi:hypothetical protein
MNGKILCGIIVFVFFVISSSFSDELIPKQYSDYDISWTLERTNGFISLTHTDEQAQETEKTDLGYTGIILKIRKSSFFSIDSTFNFCFENRPVGMFADNTPDYYEQLSAVENFTGIAFSYTPNQSLTLKPFVGYTYLDFTLSGLPQTEAEKSVYEKYQTFDFGLSASYLPFRWLTIDSRFSYSPYIYSLLHNRRLGALRYSINMIFNTKYINLRFIFNTYRIYPLSFSSVNTGVSHYENVLREFGFSYLLHF